MKIFAVVTLGARLILIEKIEFASDIKFIGIIE